MAKKLAFSIENCFDLTKFLSCNTVTIPGVASRLLVTRALSSHRIVLRFDEKITNKLFPSSLLCQVLSDFFQIRFSSRSFSYLKGCAFSSEIIAFMTRRHIRSWFTGVLVLKFQNALMIWCNLHPGISNSPETTSYECEDALYIVFKIGFRDLILLHNRQTSCRTNEFTTFTKQTSTSVSWRYINWVL